MPKLIEASAPGKLYIAGEYAVVEPGHSAILVAVNQFIKASIRKTEKRGSLHSLQFTKKPIPWDRKDSHIVLKENNQYFQYILKAIELTESYVQELGKTLSFYDLIIDSELDNDSGLKYGLGSSAAVTVSTIRALCRFYGVEETDLLIFKLSALAQLALKSNGSLGDVAASVSTGWVSYTSVDRVWVGEQMKQKTISEILALEWPHLDIKSLTPPEDMQLIIGWTGSPASTTHLVDQVKNKSGQQLINYQDFLTESNLCVNQMVEGFESSNIALIQRGIRQNRALLNQLASLTGVDIETATLTILCDLAEKAGGAAKSSGAGGGDCGIAIFGPDLSLNDLYNQWENNQITALPLKVYTKN